MRTLYHYWLCPFSRKVRLILAEKKLDFELEAERTWERRPEFMDLNPAGKVPVLVDLNGTAVVDSMAIAEYLDEAYPERLLIGTGLSHRAEVRRLVAWFDDKFAQEVSVSLILEKVLKKHLYKDHSGPNSAVLRLIKTYIHDHLTYISWLVDRRKWLAGDEFSLADITAAAHLSVVEETMGGHRPQFWVSDLYSAQQGHGEQWQICLAHQLRDCEYSIQEGDVYFSWRLKRLILKAIALHKRRHRPFVLSNLEKWFCRLEDELKGILEFEPETASGKRLKKRYLKNGSSLFTFLQDPRAIPATNNGSERAIRLSTIYRRVTGGFRSDWGKHFFASVRSVVNTGQKHKLTPRQSIQRALGTQPTFFLT